MTPKTLLNQKQHDDHQTIVKIGKLKIGAKKIVIMAGPCAVESEEQIVKIALAVKKTGADILRGGAFKPRTGPYDFQGHKYDGLKMLQSAKKKSGLPIITEVLNPQDVEIVGQTADILQIGTRNMQNFSLLIEAGKSRKPVLLKRGMSATYKEWLLAAEYIIKEGNPNVILCERGIRTFNMAEMRNTLDLNAIPYLKTKTHLPIIVDPSHGTGNRQFVAAMAKAAVAAGADGLILEVHTEPEKSIVDADQTIGIPEFSSLIKELRGIAKVIGRSL